MVRVLVAEDDFAISSSLRGYLELADYDVEVVYSGQAALHRVSVESFDVCLLDIGLPGIDGLTVLKRLREELRSTLPVIVVSARSDLDDRLAGFQLGADDYVVKPFALAEIEARIQALLKRTGGAMVVDPIRRFESLELDTRNGEATIDGAAIRLSPKALHLLDLLLRVPGQVVRRRHVEEALWPSLSPRPDALRRQIHRLRRALTGKGVVRLETVLGIGYRLITTRRAPVSGDAPTGKFEARAEDGQMHGAGSSQTLRRRRSADVGDAPAGSRRKGRTSLSTGSLLRT